MKDRDKVLWDIIDFLHEEISTHGEAVVNFICTHNSRRSQFAQAWSFIIAEQLNLPIRSFSGGTEVTACNERTIAALERASIDVRSIESGSNPLYEVRTELGGSTYLYSKLFDELAETKKRSIAIMTCSDADENCPYVPGAIVRLPLTFKDPKEHDGTLKEGYAYDTTSMVIRSELLFIYTQLRIKLGIIP
jgi:arsenate reductase